MIIVETNEEFRVKSILSNPNIVHDPDMYIFHVNDTRKDKSLPLSFYIVDGDNLKYSPDIYMSRSYAKKRCTEKFNAYYNAPFYDIEYNDNPCPYEFNLNIVIRDELIRYVRDNTEQTPVTDELASALGESDYHVFRMKKYDEIMHHDLTLANLVAQKQMMFKLIDLCEDPETLDSMYFNFSWPSYSNMRWRS